jgi:hypothetical protein
MRNDDVKDLISQLTRLQLQQTDLLARLDTAVQVQTALIGTSDEAEPFAQAAFIESEPTRNLEIGDKVTISNPNLFQANEGTITKIGKKRITVTTASGQKIVRAPKKILPATIR